MGRVSDSNGYAINSPTSLQTTIQDGVWTDAWKRALAEKNLAAGPGQDEDCRFR